MNDPESSLIGSMYQSVGAKADLVVTDGSSWFFDGCNLSDGDAFPNAILGEYDRYVPSFPGPRNVDVLAHSPVPGQSNWSDVTYYTAPGNGGGVLASGSASFVSLLSTTGAIPSLVIPGPFPGVTDVIRRAMENLYGRFGLGPASSYGGSGGNWSEVYTGRGRGPGHRRRHRRGMTGVRLASLAARALTWVASDRLGRARRPRWRPRCGGLIVAMYGRARRAGVGAGGRGGRRRREPDDHRDGDDHADDQRRRPTTTTIDRRRPRTTSRRPPRTRAAPGTWISTGPDETDPFMVVEDGHYDLFTSSAGPDANIPVRSATVPGQWGPVTDALPDLPAWAEPGWAWAPDVRRFGDHDVLYFTTLLRGSSPPTMCIGDAVGTRIIGPYVAQPAPFICQASLGGSIDPRTFVGANGEAYMIWKSDENAVSQTTDTRIYSQPLSADGLHLLGQPTQIFGPDEPWQGYIVEAPQLVQVDGVYYLFYSGYWFNQPGYAIGVARCSGPLGPCHDTSPDPLLGSNAQGAGPGEESVFSDAQGHLAALRAVPLGGAAAGPPAARHRRPPGIRARWGLRGRHSGLPLPASERRRPGCCQRTPPATTRGRDPPTIGPQRWGDPTTTAPGRAVRSPGARWRPPGSPDWR